MFSIIQTVTIHDTPYATKIHASSATHLNPSANPSFLKKNQKKPIGPSARNSHQKVTISQSVFRMNDPAKIANVPQHEAQNASKRITKTSAPLRTASGKPPKNFFTASNMV